LGNHDANIRIKCIGFDVYVSHDHEMSMPTLRILAMSPLACPMSHHPVRSQRSFDRPEGNGLSDEFQEWNEQQRWIRVFVILKSGAHSLLILIFHPQRWS
jgi:hypothetical protein